MTPGSRPPWASSACPVIVPVNGLLAFAAILVINTIIINFGATVVLNSLGMSTDAILDRFAGLVQVTAIVGVVLAYWLVGRFVEQRRSDSQKAIRALDVQVEARRPSRPQTGR